ncbi:hypothetical protein CVT24_010927 [Panaeolus cyanescens]|uniref:Wax synthase domain-containing protein n=1 Tax=Panaeolus cyanescens TaxID=181874 RepID=A0A409WAU4_9AGAR|nr:hypothetical protein CVT24_010927 [Panaeolus cyanescens]
MTSTPSTPEALPFNGFLYGAIQFLSILFIYPTSSRTTFRFILQLLAAVFLGWAGYYLITKTTTKDLAVDLALGSAILTQYMIAIDAIFFTDPTTLRRVGDEPGAITKKSFQEKLWWTVDLYTNARGIGWQHEPPHLPKRPHPSMGRWQFVASRLMKAVLCVALENAMYVLNASHPGTTTPGKLLTDAEWRYRALGVLGFAAAGFSRINMLNCSLISCTTFVTTKILRFPPLTRKKSLVNSIHKLVFLIVAFIIIGLVHVGGDVMLLKKMSWASFKFFAIQSIAIIAEKLVAEIWTRLGFSIYPKERVEENGEYPRNGHGNGKEKTHVKYSQSQSTSKTLEQKPHLWIRMIGYLWVAWWLVYSVAFMVNPLVSIQMLTDPKVDLRLNSPQGSKSTFRFYLQLLVTVFLGWACYHLITKTTTNDPGTDLALGSTILTQYMVAIDAIFFTDPNSLRRTGDQPGAITNGPFWEKLGWTLDLFTNPRGIGWAHEPAHLPARPNASVGRWQFVGSRLLTIALCSALGSALYIINASHPGTTTPGKLLSEADWRHRAIGVLCFAGAAFPLLSCTIFMSTKVLRFPPLSRTPSLVNSIHKVVIHVVAFLIIGLIHIGGDAMLLKRLSWGSFKFFSMQSVGITVERMVMELWTRRFGLSVYPKEKDEDFPGSKSYRNREQDASRTRAQRAELQPHLWIRVIGAAKQHFSPIIFICALLTLVIGLVLPAEHWVSSHLRRALFIPYAACLLWPVFFTTTGDPQGDMGLGGGMGTFLLIGGDFLLLNNPQKDLYRVCDGERYRSKHKPSLPARVQWALDLIFSPRGVGWNFEPPFILEKRKAMKTGEKASRSSFMIEQLIRLLLLVSLDQVCTRVNVVNPVFSSAYPSNLNGDDPTLIQVSWKGIGLASFALASYARINAMHYDFGTNLCDGRSPRAPTPSCPHTPINLKTLYRFNGFGRHSSSRVLYILQGNT